MSQQQPTTVAGMSPQTWAIIVWALFIASYFTATLSGIVGLIIAYVTRGDLVGTPFESHMTSAIRTFWISLIVGIIGSVFVVIGFIGFIGLIGIGFIGFIGFIVLLLLALWQLFRAIRGLIRAIDGQPIADPTGWL